MKKWKKAVSLCLALTMTLSLSACKSGNGLPGIGGGGGGKGTHQDSSLAKEYVYTQQEFDLKGLQGNSDAEESYIQRAMALDGRIYLMYQTYRYNENNNGPTMRIVSMNMDGGDQQVYDLQRFMDDEEFGAKGEDSDDAGDDRVVPDGAEKPEPSDPDAEASKKPVEDDAEDDDEDENDVDVPVIDDGFGIDVDVDVDYPMETSYEYMDFSNFQVSKSGLIYGTRYYSYSDYSDQDNIININENSVCCWDLKGNMQWHTPLDDLQTENSWSYVSGILIFPDDTVAVMIGGDQTGMRKMDKDGKFSALKPLDLPVEISERSNGWAAMPDGSLLVCYYDEKWMNMYLAAYDVQQNKLAEGFKMPSQMYLNMNTVVVNENNELYYCQNQNVYKYHIGDEEAVCVMSFVNSDLVLESMDYIIPVDDEHFVAFYNSYDETTYRSSVAGGLFTKVDPADIPDKEVLVLGGSYIGSDIRKRVVDYNKSSSTHRIVLKDYSSYITYDETDYSANYTKLNNDIISGNMPDILFVDTYGMSVENFALKGLLADIGALIEKDEELSKKEFLENVFDACRIKGKLYEIIPAFSVQTYIGKKSLVGDRDRWTMAEARELVHSMPEGTQLFGDMLRNDFMYQMMRMCGSDFVDVSSGKCNFASDEFISLLEYAKTLPEEYEDDHYDDNWYANYQSQYRENRTILSSCYIGSFRDLIYTINGQFGEEVSYIGFPNSSGQGSNINVYTTYVLSAKSANLDAAWDFMRYYLTDEYQDTLEWQLPIAKEQFDKFAQKAMEKPYYLDGNGEKVEYDDTYWINDEQITLPQLTQQQVDETKAFVMSVNKRAYNNNDISKIISEEVDAFYKGQKSAADVAGVIQSRAQIFVNENR